MTSTIENFKTGEQLRDEGMLQALTTTEMVRELWSERAHKLLEIYCRITPHPFKCEDFRAYCAGKIETPVSLRAYGGIFFAAINRKIICRIGYTQVNNPKAHKANCTLWQSLINPQPTLL